MDAAGRDVGDRRRAIRLLSPVDHGIVLARVRPGRTAAVIDISSTGALIETAHRLLPGACVEVHLELPAGRHTVRGRLVRCAITTVSATRVVYQCAIDFDDRLVWIHEANSIGPTAVADAGPEIPVSLDEMGRAESSCS